MSENCLYQVTWIIELEASSPYEAALEAFRIQRDSQSIASAFQVKAYKDLDSLIVDIDLGDDPQELQALLEAEPKEDCEDHISDDSGLCLTCDN